jgi:hypothetical protein
MTAFDLGYWLMDLGLWLIAFGLALGLLMGLLWCIAKVCQLIGDRDA